MSEQSTALATAHSAVPAVVSKPSLLAKFATKYSVEPNKLLQTLKSTAFRQQGDAEISNEQMIALLIVSDQYGLNPFTKEIYAFPDRSGITPIVSIDGWARIINDQNEMDGIEFVYSDTTDKWESHDVPVWCECIIYRKDRSRPIRVREFFKEVRRNTQPWKSHPTRMLRHKSLIQCARVAFGFGGIYDEDEGTQVIENARAVERVEEFVVQPKNPALENRPSEIIEADLTAVQMSANVVEVKPTVAKGTVTIGTEDMPDAGAEPGVEPPPVAAAVEKEAASLAQPPAPPPSAPVDETAGASNGEYSYLQRKAKALGVSLPELAKKFGVDMQKLTKDGFHLLKEQLAKIERGE